MFIIFRTLYNFKTSLPYDVSTNKNTYCPLKYRDTQWPKILLVKKHFMSHKILIVNILQRNIDK